MYVHNTCRCPQTTFTLSNSRQCCLHSLTLTTKMEKFFHCEYSEFYGMLHDKGLVVMEGGVGLAWSGCYVTTSEIIISCVFSVSTSNNYITQFLLYSFYASCYSYVRTLRTVQTMVFNKYTQERLPMYFNLCLDGNLLTCKF